MLWWGLFRICKYVEAFSLQENAEKLYDIGIDHDIVVEMMGGIHEILMYVEIFQHL